MKQKNTGKGFAFSIRNFIKLELEDPQDKTSPKLVSLTDAVSTKGPLISFKRQFKR